MRPARAAAANTAAYLVDASNPLIRTLAASFGGFINSRKLFEPEGKKQRPKRPERIVGGHSFRTEVIGEKLCDDVLKYIAPTLEPYKGCTVIDINPGACLWSTKLHEFLRPKQHLLVEPDEGYVEPFIRPLLEKPGSTFKHAPLTAIDPKAFYQDYERIFEDGHLPPRPKYEADDSRLRQLDTSVLLTGNLARRYSRTRHDMRHLSQFDLVVNSFVWSALYNTAYQSSGLVRMLWWVPDANKALYNPKRPMMHSGFANSLHMGADITEIAGCQNIVVKPEAGSGGDFVRWDVETPRPFAIEGAKRVKDRMAARGMAIPEGRETLESALAEDEDPESVPLKDPTTVHFDTLEEVNNALEELQTRYGAAHEAVKSCKNLRMPWRGREILGPYMTTLQYPHLESFVVGSPFFRIGRQKPEEINENRKYTGHGKETSVVCQRVTVIMDLQLRIINLETHCAFLAEKGVDVQDLKRELIAFDRKFRTDLDDLWAGPIILVIHSLIMDQTSFFAQPPVTPFDRRYCEPLRASKSDFWPRFELALVDFLPKPRDLVVPGVAGRHEVAGTAYDLIKYLFLNKGSSVGWALDRIATNAAQDLLPMCKSMRDPRKGGRLNPDAMLVRMLTDEMLEELVRAWFEWPFRPEKTELALAVGEGEGKGGSGGGGGGGDDAGAGVRGYYAG